MEFSQNKEWNSAKTRNGIQPKHGMKEYRNKRSEKDQLKKMEERM